MALYPTEFEGRKYTVETRPENHNRPMSEYLTIRRVRKDGKPGAILTAHRPESWNVWKTVRDQALRDEGLAK